MWSLIWNFHIEPYLGIAPGVVHSLHYSPNSVMNFEEGLLNSNSKNLRQMCYMHLFFVSGNSA
jgi:hypothetical protein